MPYRSALEKFEIDSSLEIISQLYLSVANSEQKPTH